jgi:uncharacterized coiled-coil DUF342 family protein
LSIGSCAGVPKATSGRERSTIFSVGKRSFPIRRFYGNVEQKRNERAKKPSASQKQRKERKLEARRPRATVRSTPGERRAIVGAVRKAMKEKGLL